MAARRSIGPSRRQARSGRSWGRRSSLAGTLTALTIVCCLLAPAASAGAAPSARFGQARLAPASLHRARLTVATGGEKYLGDAVAISGDTALVGAPGYPSGAHTGAAYVFVRSGGVWKLQKKLVAPDGGAGDDFGLSVAISGNTALVGASSHNIAGLGRAGAAYVFVRSSGVWKLQEELTYDVPSPGDFFGDSVALNGDTALVGVPGMDWFAGTDAGAACVYIRSGGKWYLQQALVGYDAAPSDDFGASVALSTDTAVVGAPWHDTGGKSDAGAAYVFVRSAGVWTRQPPDLHAGDAAVQDELGFSVALSGNTAVIGAPRRDSGGKADAGAAYVFFRSSGAWSQQAQLTADDGNAQDEAGYSVDVTGGRALLGSPGNSGGSIFHNGATYDFARSGVTWAQQRKLTAADNAEDAHFGSSVGLSGETALLGAPDRGSAGGTSYGAAYVFQPKPTIIKLAPASGKRGSVVTISGDAFGRTRSGGCVRFGAKTCLKYVSWHNKVIKCRVPATAALGALKVKVTIKAGSSNTKSFTVKH
jgi:hypothetical protein